MLVYIAKSPVEAANKLNLNKSCVGAILNKKQKQTKGYTFTYLED